MSMKICPLMSGPLNATGIYDQQVVENEWVNCQEEYCQFWTKAEVRNEQPGIRKFEEGCAIQLNARKGLGNYIHTDD